MSCPKLITTGQSVRTSENAFVFIMYVTDDVRIRSPATEESILIEYSVVLPNGKPSSKYVDMYAQRERP
jgi:hypothetical protein